LKSESRNPKSERRPKSEIRSGAGISWLLLAGMLLGLGVSSQAASASGNERVAKLTAVLQSGSPQKEKADACRELAQIGDKNAVAALAALLPDEKLSHMARYGLETIPDASVDKAFRDALDHLKGPQLVGVIGSIGVRRDAKATKPLAKLLTDPDPDVAQAAARALGKIGTAQAARAIENALGSVPAGNQVAFCEGLFRCAERLAAEGRSKEAVAIYDRVRKLEAPHQVRTAALRGSILARGKDGVPLLTQSLRSPDYPVFAAATRISQEMPGRDVTQVLMTELANTSGDRQLMLTQTLGKRGDPSALPALFEAAKKCEKPVRLAAIHAVSELCDPSAVRLFQDLLTDKDTEIATAAKEALGALPGMEADSAALFMLRSSDPNRRDLGFELIGRRRMTSALPDLLKMAANGDSGVKLAALKKIGELGGPRELPGLLELLGSATTPQDLEATEQALNMVATKTSDTEATARQLAESFAKASLPQKCSLVRVLAAVGGPTALNCVRTAVKDSSTELRSSAIRALGTWSNPEAAPDLLELARGASDPNEKMLCLRSYLAWAGQSELPADKALAMCREAAGLVQQPEEKKLLLGSLGNISSPDSFPLILPYLEDASVKNEAATACISVSEKLLKASNNSNAAQVMEPLRKLMETKPNADMEQKARSLLDQAQKKSGH